jgi:hypothetical protein
LKQNRIKEKLRMKPPRFLCEPSFDGLVNAHDLEAVTPTYENVGAGFTAASGRV